MPILLQPHFLVTTFLTIQLIFSVATRIPGCDLDWCPQLTFLSQHQFWFATNYVFFLLYDLKAVSRHEGWIFLSMLLSQLLKCMSRHEFLVATLIGILNLYLCRNLKLPSRDITSPFSITFWSRHHFSIVTNNIFFSCRDLKTVSRHYLP